jgi:hypothetical protein
MFHKKLLILLCGSLLGAAGARADDVGYVDCSGHPEETQIYAKPRRSQDVVVKVPCGERFRVVLYGFIFSKVQTSDGKVGFILSSMISLDRVGGVPQQWETRPASPVNPPTTTVAPVQPVPAPAAATDSVAKQVAPAPEPTPSAQPATAASVNIQPANEQPAAAPVAVVSAAPPAKPANSTQESASISTETSTSRPAAPVAAPAPQPPPALTETTAPDSTAASLSSPAVTQPTAPEPTPAAPPIPATAEPTAPAKEDVAAASVQPAQPSPASTSRPQPATYSVQPASMSQPIERTSWEKPNPGGKRPSLLELFGGYSFTRTNSSGTKTNFNGALGAFGLNLRPWLQIIGDSSYSTVTQSGIKYTLYGNHFGPRFFFRRPNRWNVTPFAEFLIGGSRIDTSISGLSGYASSENCISYKVGGGVDIRAGRHFEFRAIDGGYYRTSFGTNLTQNNYYVSTGFVVRLFGGGRGF